MATRRSIEELTQQNVEIIAEMEKSAAQARTRRERVADRLAAWVGSWTFLTIQSLILLTWIIINLAAWIEHWDPYPFILLNLVLAFQAAYAAPILMISQNRQSKLSEPPQSSGFADQHAGRAGEHGDPASPANSLRGASGVALHHTENNRAFEEQTSHAEIVRQIQTQIEEPAQDITVAREGAGEPGASSDCADSPPEAAELPSHTLTRPT